MVENNGEPLDRNTNGAGNEHERTAFQPAGAFAEPVAEWTSERRTGLENPSKGLSRDEAGEAVDQDRAGGSAVPQQEPGPTQPEQPQQTNSLSTAGLVCGIIGVIVAFIPGLNFFMGGILGILATVFGVIARKQDGSGKAGLILGVITLVIILLWLIVLLVIAIILGEADPMTF